MILDLAIVLVLVLFCVRSFIGGIQGELLGATGWILAILIAISFSEIFGNIIADKVPQIAVFSSIAAFAFVLLILRLLIGWMVKLAPDSEKGSSNLLLRLVSVAMGFFKGAFFTSVFLLLLSQSALQPKLYDEIKDSSLYKPISDFSKHVVRIVTAKVPNVKPLLDRSAGADEQAAE